MSLEEFLALDLLYGLGLYLFCQFSVTSSPLPLLPDAHIQFLYFLFDYFKNLSVKLLSPIFCPLCLCVKTYILSNM